MSTRSGILAGGNWIVDRLKVIDVYPDQDALANVLRQSTGNGGSPFNLLLDLARLGAAFPLAGAGLVGEDADGAWVLERCRRHGIDTAQIGRHPSAPTSSTDVFTVEKTGRRTFFHQRGANAFLDGEHFDFAATGARIFHLGYLLLLDRLDAPDPKFGTVAARVLARAREAGCKTSIDVVSEDSHRFRQVVLPALPQVDYCLLNEFELGRTTGLRVRRESGIDFNALREAAGRLLDEGVREWVIVHYPEGACALGPDGRLHEQGSLRLAQEDIASAVGAGDAFAAGALHALHEGLPIEAVLRDGACAAAASLRGHGTSDGVQSLAECRRLADRYGVRAPAG